MSPNNERFLFCLFAPVLVVDPAPLLAFLDVVDAFVLPAAPVLVVDPCFLGAVFTGFFLGAVFTGFFLGAVFTAFFFAAICEGKRP